MPNCHGRAAKAAAIAREHRDSDTPKAAAIRAELERLHVTTSFASPSSHLYHQADTTCPRPPAGIELKWTSNLRHVSVENARSASFYNQLGQPLCLPAPPLQMTSKGVCLPESVRQIMARGGATSRDLVPEDAELVAYENSKGSLQERAKSLTGTAAEIMSRDTCVVITGFLQRF